MELYGANVGAKIKGMATIFVVLGVLASCIVGGLFIAGDELQIGLLIIGGGVLSAYLGNIVTYGFGQLVENSDIIVRHLHSMEEKTQGPDGATTDFFKRF